MYISLFSVLSLLVCGSIARVLTPNPDELPNLVGLALLGSEPDVLNSEMDLIAAAKGANFFRIPIEWQSLVNNYPASISFDAAVFARYDRLVQEALATGAHVMIDLHNTGKWKTTPNDDDFANLWFNLADFYSSDSKVIFGIMNEPHHLDMSKWSVTVQGAINSIRAAGASSQSIAIAGDSSLAQAWINGTNAAFMKIIDPASKKKSDRAKLVIDIHEKIGSQSGKCSVRHLRRLATWLEVNRRTAIVSEIGGEAAGNCLSIHLDYITEDDAFVGFAVAAQFPESQEMSLQQDALVQRFLQPNLLPNEATQSSKDGPSATPIPEINRQLYTGDLGTEATPVYDYEDDQSIVGAQVFARRLDAVGTSCSQQRSACLDAAARWGYVEPLTIPGCNNQYQACLRTAVDDHEATGNLAPANLQTFAGTEGGSAPSIYPILSEFIVEGVAYADSVLALRTSCDLQYSACYAVSSLALCSAQSNACYTNSGVVDEIPEGYTVTNCLRDSVDNRVLQGANFGSDSMTHGTCVSYCSGLGFAYAGLEYGTECFCGDEIRGEVAYLDSSQCNLPCGGSSEQICGGNIALTLFTNPDKIPAGLPAGWSNYGCMWEPEGARALSEFYVYSEDMTPRKCATECQAEGYRYAGAEYSSECYCSNTVNPASNPAPAGECNMACSGDESQICGGSGTLSTWYFDPI